MCYVFRWCCLLLFMVFGGAPFARAKVAIETEGSPRKVQSAGYEARVEADGCLTSLKIAGREWLASKVNVSRGGYFFQEQTLALAVAPEQTPGVIEASGPAAAVRYEFTDDAVHFDLSNSGEKELVYFLVFTSEVDSALTAEGALAGPITKDLSKVALVARDQKLDIEGCDKLWGPWQGDHQVCQVTLPAKANKRLTIRVGRVSADEQQLLAALAPKVSEPLLSIYSPRDWQVLQRGSDNRATLLISGHTSSAAKQIRYRITGSDAVAAEWQPIEVTEPLHRFSTSVSVPAGGWYHLEVEAREGAQVLATSKIEQFGVGEVFVGAGQSNSTNCGEEKTSQTSGMVSSFGGDTWRLANDPQPGVADKSQGGSFWPAFGDEMYRRYRVPIGVATTGFGGTSVNRWQPDGDLFPWLLTRVHQLGPHGFRALLWHQGESDVDMPSEEYYAKLHNVIHHSRQQAGWHIPWFVAHVSYHNAEKPSFETVRSAQAKLWAEGVALPGPDTDTLTGDHRDFDGKGIHFSPKGLHAHGVMWAECVSKELGAQLPKSE